jgi:regulatory protein
VNQSDITPELLERWALGYLGRYASSAENLRRVLRRRVRRRSRDDAEAVQHAAPMSDAVVERHCHNGLLDDTAYAAQRSEWLTRKGASLAKIRARLVAKGVPGAIAAEALAALCTTSADPDLAAACTLARRRRLGPYRSGAADPMRDLAAFARAGFSRRVAEAVLACNDIEAVEALARNGLG